MKGHPWQAQINQSGRWVSMTHEGSPYVYETSEAAAEALRRWYPELYRQAKLDTSETRCRVLNTETGEVCPAWRLA
jgi:hypothetical protein